jgi:hypothetical protein
MPKCNKHEPARYDVKAGNFYIQIKANARGMSAATDYILAEQAPSSP